MSLRSEVAVDMVATSCTLGERFRTKEMASRCKFSIDSYVDELRAIVFPLSVAVDSSNTSGTNKQLKQGDAG